MNKKNTTEKQLLKNPDEVPSEELFDEILSSEQLQVYEEIQNLISEFGLNMEWKYYNDGKSWLCKITLKKKTIVWMSVWEDFFKSSIYFTEKTRLGIEDLDIKQSIKSSFSKQKPIGKLIPLILDIYNIDDLDDFKKVIKYKISLK